VSPPLDSVLLLADLPLLCLDLRAVLAALHHRDALPHQFHATRLAGSVFLGAVGSKVAPLPVAAWHSILLVVAHIYSMAFKGRVLVEMSGDLLVGRRLSMNVFKVSLIEVLCA
jgi:hypothetical protein